jgi:hypothetical protein
MIWIGPQAVVLAIAVAVAWQFIGQETFCIVGCPGIRPSPA